MRGVGVLEKTGVLLRREYTLRIPVAPSVLNSFSADRYAKYLLEQFAGAEVLPGSRVCFLVTMPPAWKASVCQRLGCASSLHERG
jgi:hypothetical protein